MPYRDHTKDAITGVLFVWPLWDYNQLGRALPKPLPSLRSESAAFLVPGFSRGPLGL